MSAARRSTDRPEHSSRPKKMRPLMKSELSTRNASRHQSWRDLLWITLPILLSACGGGGGTAPSNSAGSTGVGTAAATSYTVTATAGTGGSISPANAAVASGGTATFTVTADSGYAIQSVTGCAGSLSGSTFTTGSVTASCTVTASFSAAAATVPTQWAWESGADTVSATSVYGTEGQPAAGNGPGARDRMTSWMDSSGNLWIFGGEDYLSATFFNDLWEYTPSTGEWTWEGGSQSTDAAGIYGTEGQPSSGNIPGARQGSARWVDAKGNIWLFGGLGFDASGNLGELNDLWKYSPSTHAWTWEGGSQSADAAGVYGSQGQPAPADVPGARSGAVSWIDSSGNLWMFGGWGLDSTGTVGSLNDLWKYTPSTGEWTWEGGSNTVDTTAVSGTEGQPSPNNIPGGRWGASSWVDASGRFWLFGGQQDGINGAPLNDLWEYTPSTGEWTWEGGSTTPGAAGVYGTQGQPSPNNIPGARWDASSWVDASGNLWLFGGGIEYYGGGAAYDDLWRYTPSTGEWTWEGLDGRTGPVPGGGYGVYGTQGQPSANNFPGGRFGAAAQIDAQGNVWLFGGYGGDANGTYGPLNDLWKAN